MSAFGKQGVRCDSCGKFSRNRLTGEYVRKDGSAGYIWPDETSDGKDICDDCLAKNRESETDQMTKEASRSVTGDRGSGTSRIVGSGSFGRNH